jgi:hypothetical protein
MNLDISRYILFHDKSVPHLKEFKDGVSVCLGWIKDTVSPH